MNRIIDLRKKKDVQPIPQTQPAPSVEAMQQSAPLARIVPQKPPASFMPKTAVIAPVPQTFSWQVTAHHIPHGNKKSVWLSAVALIGGGALIIFQKDFLAATVLILAIGVIVLHRYRPHRLIAVAVTQAGITVAGQTHYFKDLKSFWIEYNPGSICEMSLETKKWYLPYIRIPLEHQNPIHLRSHLARTLPEREHELSLIDLWMRK